ncbi:MAG: hypothetical protein OHK0056_31560 [Bacteriovoracaceae bacterium]
MKGHPALFIPAILFVHLIITRELKQLKSVAPWIGLLLGFGIFLIWPLLLWSIGRFDGFQLWFQKQFLETVAEARQIERVDYFLYFKILGTFCLPWLLLTLYSNFKSIKEKKYSDINSLAMIWFWVILIPMSLMKWKLNHYILPLYPAMAILASSALMRLIPLHIKKINTTIVTLIAVSSLVLATLPVGTKSKRYTQVFTINQVLKDHQLHPMKWGIFNESTDYWGFAANGRFMTKRDFFHVNRDNMMSMISEPREWLIYINKNDYESYLKSTTIFKPLVYFQKTNSYALVASDKELNFVISNE